MSHIKLRGFIVREIPVGEADRIINILSADQGLISASARGARRTKSRLLASTQIFVLSDFELFAYKGRYTVDDAQLVESFSRLRQDIERLICASHLAEVLIDCTREAVPDPEIYKIWAYSLNAIQAHADPQLSVHAAQLRLLAQSGFALHLDSCVGCSQPMERQNSSSSVQISISAGGSVCGKTACRRNDSQLISRAVYNCLQHCQEAPLPQLFNFRLSAKARREFTQLSGAYLVSQMEKNYTRLKMLDDLSGFSAAPRTPAIGSASHQNPAPAADAIHPETAGDRPEDQTDRRPGE